MSVSKFVPATALEQAIHAGILEGVIAALRALSQQERRAQAAAIKYIEGRLAASRWESDGKIAAWWGAKPTLEQIGAAGSALFFCGGSQERAQNWQYNDSLYPYLDLLEPAALRSLATELVNNRPVYFTIAQRLVRDGLSDRPGGDEYTIAFMALPQLKRGAESILAAVDEDPALLDEYLLRIFDVEGTGDTNMASIEKYAHGHSWTFALLQLARDGRLDRAQLLERCLSTLEKDWPQFRAGWFSRFHDQLAPTLDEMHTHRARYLGLCHSRIPPTVALALNALAALMKAARVETEPLLDALAPVMTSAVKGQIEAALKLLDQVVKKEPGRAHAASALARHALAHEAPDLHKKTIARLAAWGFDESTRADLEAALQYVCALHREALAALVGAAPEVPAPAAAHAHVEKGVLSPLDPSRRLAPLDDVDELVQTIAFVFENEREIDAFERALDALARLGPRLRHERQRFSPVLKRAQKMIAGDHDIGGSLAHVLIAAFDGTVFQHNGEHCTSRSDLLRRIADLTVFMSGQCGLSPLASATHKRGFIEPLLLVERIAAHAQAGAVSSLEEQVRALLRLVPGPAPEALQRLAALAQTPFVQACRYALGDDEVEIGGEHALFCAAARIRHPDRDDARLLVAYGDMGADGAIAARFHWSAERWDGPPVDHFIQMEVRPPAQPFESSFIALRRHSGGKRDNYFSWGESTLLYAAAIIPASLEGFFANGALQIGANINWWEARWYDKAYLTVVMDRTVPATPSAVKMIALALGGKEPGQTGMAIDAFVALLLEERTDVASVAGEIRWVLLSLLGTGARYAKNLGKAAQAHPSMPAAIVAALCVILDIGDAEPPKDTGALLELLLELLLANKLALPADARDNIARFRLTGKARAAQKELLARS